MSNELLTTQQAAERMGRSVKWVRYLIAEGRLPAQKFGPVYMVQSTDVDNFEHKPRGKPPAQNGHSAVTAAPAKKKATKKIN